MSKHRLGRTIPARHRGHSYTAHRIGFLDPDHQVATRHGRSPRPGTAYREGAQAGTSFTREVKHNRRGAQALGNHNTYDRA
jgi:hypothetical protein